MTIEPGMLVQILLAIASGAGVYAAIRADLARLHERTQAAHERIDWLQTQVFK